MSFQDKWREIKKTIIRARFSLFILSDSRVRYLKRHNIFADMGDNIYWATRFYPADPKQLLLHNNILVARDVNFIMHDNIHLVINNEADSDAHVSPFLGCIEIMDNVAIGSGVQICPNVRIGPNAIIGAGAVVVKDVPEGVVVAGVPARVVGSYDSFIEKRIVYTNAVKGMSRQEKLDYAWSRFHEERRGD